MKYLLTLLFICLLSYCSYAQELSFKDTVSNYNRQRISRNIRGMEVLGAWGIVNMAAGTIGYFNAKEDEWKYFHGMNAAWGLMNTLIAAEGLGRAQRERRRNPDFQQSYKRYKSDKRHYLINSCFDVVYIGVGVGLTKYADKAENNPEVYRGFGKSIVLQGVFLLIFDNMMYAAQLKNNSKWHRIMHEIHITNNGMGFNYNFKYKDKFAFADLTANATN